MSCDQISCTSRIVFKALVTFESPKYINKNLRIFQNNSYYFITVGNSKRIQVTILQSANNEILSINLLLFYHSNIFFYLNMMLAFFNYRPFRCLGTILVFVFLAYLIGTVMYMVVDFVIAVNNKPTSGTTEAMISTSVSIY